MDDTFYFVLKSKYGVVGPAPCVASSLKEAIHKIVRVSRKIYGDDFELLGYFIDVDLANKYRSNPDAAIYWVAIYHDVLAGDIIMCEAENPDEAIESVVADFRKCGFNDPTLICCSTNFDTCCVRFLEYDKNH